MQSEIKVGQRFKFNILSDNRAPERQAVVARVLSNSEEALGPEVDFTPRSRRLWIISRYRDSVRRIVSGALLARRYLRKPEYHELNERAREHTASRSARILPLWKATLAHNLTCFTQPGVSYNAGVVKFFFSTFFRTTPSAQK